jgi:hypothetical protein
MSKKHYSLIGVDGNAFCIMGYVRNAMKETGYTRLEIEDYTKDATSSDYNHLLMVSAKQIEDCNKYLKI